MFGCSKALFVVMFVFSTLQMNEPDMEIMNELIWDASICYRFFLF